MRLPNKFVTFLRNNKALAQVAVTIDKDIPEKVLIIQTSKSAETDNYASAYAEIAKLNRANTQFRITDKESEE